MSRIPLPPSGRPYFFRLDREHKIAVPCDPEEWGREFAHDDRIVRQDTLPGGIEVSTIFLGIDHNHMAFMQGSDDPPILFETMVFDDYDSGEQHRYATWAEAEEGHMAIVARILATVIADTIENIPTLTPKEC